MLGFDPPDVEIPFHKLGAQKCIKRGSELTASLPLTVLSHSMMSCAPRLCLSSDLPAIMDCAFELCIKPSTLSSLELRLSGHYITAAGKVTETRSKNTWRFGREVKW